MPAYRSKTPRRKSAAAAESKVQRQIQMMKGWGSSVDVDDEFSDRAAASKATARGGKPMQTFLDTMVKPVRAPAHRAAPGPAVPRCLARSAKTPANRQAEIAKHLLHRRSAIAVHGVGTGKTLLAVLASECVLRNVPMVRKVVVITPLSLVANFYEALRDYAPRSEAAYKVLTYEDFDACYRDLAVDAKGKLRPDLKPLRAQIAEDFGDAVLVIDEAHNLRTEIEGLTGKRRLKGRVPYFAVLAGRYAQRVLLLTATPMVNAPADIANLLAIARGDGAPFSKAEMNAILSSPAALRRAAAGMLSFYEAKRNVADYPRVIQHDMRLSMTRAQQRAYEQVERGIVGDSGINSANPKAFYTGLRQALNLPDVSVKADEVAALLLREPPRRRRAIVYAQFIEHGVKTLERALDRAGLGHAKVVGSMSLEQRMAAKATFDAGEVEVMILSEAGGTGLSFKGVRHFFLFEPTWTPSEEIQAIGRANRYKSHVGLPPAERTLTVHKLRVSKAFPKSAGDDLSADDILIELGVDKAATLNASLKALKKLDIGKTFGKEAVGSVDDAEIAPPTDLTCESAVMLRRRKVDGKKRRSGRSPKRRSGTSPIKRKSNR